MSGQEIHKRLDNYSEIANAVNYINKRIKSCGFNFMEDSDCRSRSFASNCVKAEDKALVILASFDFSYYHDLEMIFYNVYISTVLKEYSWWDHWTKDQLEISKDIFKDENGNSFFEFRFNIGTNKDKQHIIRAEKFSYHFGHMSYWNF